MVRPSIVAVSYDHIVGSRKRYLAKTLTQITKTRPTRSQLVRYLPIVSLMESITRTTVFIFTPAPAAPRSKTFPERGANSVYFK